MNSIEERIKNVMAARLTSILGERPYISAVVDALISKHVIAIDRVFVLNARPDEETLFVLVDKNIVTLKNVMDSVDEHRTAYYDYLDDNDLDEFQYTFNEYIQARHINVNERKWVVQRVDKVGSFCLEIVRLGNQTTDEELKDTYRRVLEQLKIFTGPIMFKIS